MIFRLFVSVIYFNTSWIQFCTHCSKAKSPDELELSGLFTDLSKYYFFLKNKRTGTPVKLKFWRNWFSR
jgi:hypothetical protein